MIFGKCPNLDERIVKRAANQHRFRGTLSLPLYICLARLLFGDFADAEFSIVDSRRFAFPVRYNADVAPKNNLTEQTLGSYVVTALRVGRSPTNPRRRIVLRPRAKPDVDRGRKAARDRYATCPSRTKHRRTKAFVVTTRPLFSFPGRLT